MQLTFFIYDYNRRPDQKPRHSVSITVSTYEGVHIVFESRRRGKYSQLNEEFTSYAADQIL